MKNLLHITLMFIFSSTLFAQLTPVKLSNWRHEGLLSNGNWIISADSSSVRQTVNDEPTFFVSQDTFENVTIRGSFYVDATDDDFIGFVFGYIRPVSAEEYFDFYLLDWKSITQAGANEGFTLSKVQGYVNVGSGTNTSHPYWDHMDTTQTVLDTLYGDYGWARGNVYNFELIYEPNRVRISIDTAMIFDITGEFPPGRFGFYNYSQPGVYYQEFRVNEAPIAVNDYVVILEDSNVSIQPTLNDFDADGHEKTITLVEESIHGVVSHTPGDSIVYYTPNANFVGLDSFYYHIEDGNGGSDFATVVINITPVNDPPVRITPIPDNSIIENSLNFFLVAINDYFNDVDENDAFLDDFLITSSGNVTVSSSSDSLYISSQDFVGFDTLFVSVFDDSGQMALDTVIIEVINQNTPPFVVNAIPDTVLDINSPVFFYRKLNHVFADLDANDAPLDSFNISTQGVVKATLSGDSLYLGANGFTGLDTLIITAVDDSNAVYSDTFIVEVQGISALEDINAPNTFSLRQNYPNPFNPSTTIEFTLPNFELVELKVYNILGKEISTLISQKLSPGEHSYTFNAGHLASGIYYLRLVAGPNIEIRKMVLMK